MSNQEVFLALVRAGLWNEEVQLESYDIVDFDEVRRLTEEQSVVGLVTAGLEKLPAGKLPLTEKLKFIGLCQLIEQRNVAMNQFIGALIRKLNAAVIKAVLVKGQGIAQCYEKPLWRKSGDVDLFFDADNYRKAVELLKPLASNCKHEGRYSKHLGLTIDSWYIELQGTQRVGLSSRLERVIDDAQRDTFKNNRTRIWYNGDVDVLLPAPDNDVFFVFNHFIKHLYKEKMSLRQICDWCRLLWAYRTDIDSSLLKTRLQKGGLIGEWKAFAALAVDSLGMPVDAIPLYEDEEHWHKKGEKLLNFILKNRKPNKVRDTIFFLGQFPCNTLSFLPSIFLNVNRLKIKERLVG